MQNGLVFLAAVASSLSSSLVSAVGVECAICGRPCRVCLSGHSPMSPSQVLGEKWADHDDALPPSQFTLFHVLWYFSKM